MDSAVAGLIGAAIGALAGLLGSVFTTYFQTTQEHQKWLRDKRVESYSNTIRYLTRLLNKRSAIMAEGGAYIGEEIIKEWFDDLSEALVWLSSLSIYCSKNQQRIVSQVFGTVDDAASKFVATGSCPLALNDVISSALNNIVECARKDIGRAVK